MKNLVHCQATGVVLGISLALGGMVAFCGSVAAHPLSTVYKFCSKRHCIDGSDPKGLIADNAGNLYGVADTGGGIGAQGTVYELIGAKKFKLLHQFCLHNDCSDGQFPLAPLIIDVNGNVYGTTSAGGANGLGVVFEITTDGAYHKLYDFCSQGGGDCTDGGLPDGGLTYAGAETGIPYDGVSPLYGVTPWRAENNSGTAYALSHSGDSWSLTVLYTFCSQGGANCTDGSHPRGNLLVDANGNLFGVTSEGGTNRTTEFANGSGTVFELSPTESGWMEAVLYNFCSRASCADGGSPGASLLQDSTGTFYGTTFGGGHRCTLDGREQSCGVVFSLSPNEDTWQESVLHAFCKKVDCPDGAGANSALVMDAAGNLFGTAGVGGGNDIDQDHFGGGVLYEMSGTKYKNLYSFCALANCADGQRPNAVILVDNVLYGTTSSTVFKLKP